MTQATIYGVIYTLEKYPQNGQAMSNHTKIMEAQEALGSIYDLSQQLEREGTVAEWWTEAHTEAIVKAAEALAALAELDTTNTQAVHPLLEGTTPGEWFMPEMSGPYNVPGTTSSGKADWCYYINSKEAHEFCPASSHGQSPEEARANATLIADAGTTYNSCGMLPSEMWAKLREAVSAIARLKQQADLCAFVDDHGHELRINAAYLDLVTLNLPTAAKAKSRDHEAFPSFFNPPASPLGRGSSTEV